jgi:hypothetical protein
MTASSSTEIPAINRDQARKRIGAADLITCAASRGVEQTAIQEIGREGWQAEVIVAVENGVIDDNSLWRIRPTHSSVTARMS